MTTAAGRGAIAPASGGKRVAVFGIEVEFLLTGAETGGAFSSYRVYVQPGVGAPPHVHRQDNESFYVLEGEFEILCGETLSLVGPGAFVFLPRDIPHYFRNAGTTAGVLLGVGTPAGHERFFEDVHSLGPDPDPEAAIEVCLKHGIELVAPAP